jgi:alkylation response protein AidB-like acyl-CoA dehydrogenase
MFFIGWYADFFVTAVRTGGEGIGGISLLLIEKSMKGVSTRRMKVMGSWFFIFLLY